MLLSGLDWIGGYLIQFQSLIIPRRQRQGVIGEKTLPGILKVKLAQGEEQAGFIQEGAKKKMNKWNCYLIILELNLRRGRIE